MLPPRCQPSVQTQSNRMHIKHWGPKTDQYTLDGRQIEYEYVALSLKDHPFAYVNFKFFFRLQFRSDGSLGSKPFIIVGHFFVFVYTVCQCAYNDEEIVICSFQVRKLLRNVLVTFTISHRNGTKCTLHGKLI